MRINHNLAALNTYRQLSSNGSATGKNIEKLSSGLRINRAGDDAAGLAISEKMRAQIRGLDQASRNSQDAISLIQTTEGALNETQNILQRMRELATQAASDTNVAVDRTEIQKEINQLSSEINRIGNTTEFNTQKLLNGDKANTLTNFTGNFGSASGAAVATASGTSSISGVAFTGTGLTAGTHTVEIKKTAQDHADFTASDATISGATGSGMEFKFSGDSITYSNSGSYMIESGFAIAWDDTTNTLTVSGSGQSGSFKDDVVIGSGGTLSYNNFGVSFSIDVSHITSNSSLTLATSGSVTPGTGSTFGTKQVGYSGTNAGSNQWLKTSVTIGTPTSGAASGTALPTTNMTWVVKLSGNDGANGFTISGTGADGTVIQDAIATDVSAATVTYNAYGLNFQVSGASGMANDTVTFTTTPRFDYSFVVDGGASGTIMTSGSGGDAISAGSGVSGGGIKFSGTSLAVGTSSFTVHTAGSSGTDKSVSFQIGANQNQSMSLDINDMRADSIGVTSDSAGQKWVEISRKHQDLVDAGTMKSGGDTGVGGEAGKWYVQATYSSDENVTDGTNATAVQYGLDMSNSTNASAAVTVINDAIERVSSERAKLGANQNRLEHTINNLATSSENLTAAESRIRDVDMAKEMMTFTKNNILMQASQAMLAQANQQPQGVLQLLR